MSNRRAMAAFSLFLAAQGSALPGAEASAPAAAGQWRASLTPLAHARFLPMPEGRAEYRFGWSGVTAASGTLTFSRPDPGPDPAGTPPLSVLRAEFHTTGVVRTLWRLDATAFLTSDLAAARPVRVRQFERYRGRSVVFAAEFDARGVTHAKGRLPGAPATAPPGFFTPPPAGPEQAQAALSKITGAKAKRFKSPEVLDLQSALLFVRAQPLGSGDVLRFLVFQDSHAYLAEVRVAGRESVAVAAGRFPAIRLELGLRWVDKHLVLQPHENFKRATGWLSDDGERLLLKVESEVFVGSIWGELVRFTPRGA